MRKRDIREGDYVRVEKIKKSDYGWKIDTRFSGRPIESFIGQKGWVYEVFDSDHYLYRDFSFACAVRFAKYHVNFRANEIERIAHSSQIKRPGAPRDSSKNRVKTKSKEEETKPFDWVLYDAQCNKVKKSDEKLLDKMESMVHKFEQFEKVKIIKGAYKHSIGEIADLHYCTHKNIWCFHVNTKNIDDGEIDMVICYEDQLKSIQNSQWLVEVYNCDESKPIQIVKSIDEARKIAESSVDETFFGAKIYEIDSKGKIQKFQTYDRYINGAIYDSRVFHVIS